MKPFILAQHDKDRAELKELRESEIQQISGGQRVGGGGATAPQQPGTRQNPIKLNTATITPDADGGDDGADEG